MWPWPFATRAGRLEAANRSEGGSGLLPIGGKLPCDEIGDHRGRVHHSYTLSPEPLTLTSPSTKLPISGRVSKQQILSHLIVASAGSDMSSAPHVERFKGTSWEECHDFIAAIRARALWEGKQRDLAWKADFAAPLFWGKALGWHNKLPEDVCDDWSRLETALLDRWPAQGYDDEPEIQPTPAAAPSINRNDKANHPLHGVLKVVVDRSNTNYYVKRPASGSPCTLTEDRNEALRVRCDSLPSATLLERLDHWCQSRLAAQWAYQDPVVRERSNQFARLTCVDSDTLKSAWGIDRPFQFLTCTVLANGEVISAWKKDSMSHITLVPFVEDTAGLTLAADPETYAKGYPRDKRAKLFIEATD